MTPCINKVIVFRPFDEIPVELLALIFDFFIDNGMIHDTLYDPIDVLILLEVCLLWRTVALRTKALWEPFLAFYSSSSTIQVRGEWTMVPQSATTPNLSLQLIPPPRGMTRLCSSNTFSGPPSAFGDPYGMGHHTTRPGHFALGILEDLEIHVPKDLEIHTLFEDFPNPSRLRTLRIQCEGNHVCGLQFPAHFPDLTILDAQGSLTMPEFSQLLACSSKLDRCKITLTDVGLQHGRYDMKSPSLTHLNITYSNSIPRTYGPSSFEKLQELVVWSKYPILAASYIVGPRNCLKRLSLQTTQGGGTSDLFKILELCGDLETLELSTALPMNKKTMEAIKKGTIVPELHRLECGPTPSLRAFIDMLWKGLGEDLSITQDENFDELFRLTLDEQPPCQFSRVVCHGFGHSLQADMAADASAFPYDFSFVSPVPLSRL